MSNHAIKLAGLYWPYVSRQRLMLATALVFITIFLEYTAVYILGLFFAKILGQQFNAPFSDLMPEFSLTELLFLVPGLALVKSLMASALAWNNSQLSEIMYKNCVTAIIRNVFSGAVTNITKMRAADLNKAFNTEAYYVSQLLSVSVGILAEMIIFVGLLTVLIVQQPGAFIFVGGIIVVLATLYIFLLHPRLRILGLNRERAHKEIYALVQDLAANLNVLRFCGNAEFLNQKIEPYLIAFNNSNVQGNVINSSIKPAIEFLGISIFCLLVFLIFQSDSSEDIVGSFFILLGVAALRLLPSLSRILTGFSQVSLYMASINVVGDLLQPQPNNRVSKLSEPLKDVGGIQDELRIKNVKFSFEHSSTTLQVHDFVVKYGQSALVTGGSGSGKSTFLNLLVGNLPASPIDENAVSLSATDTNKIFGYSPQFPMMFRGSVEENIVFGRKYDKSLIMEVLNIVGFSNAGELRKRGLNDLGSDLSGGQKSRLGLARALYGKPDVLLMDEPTASLGKKDGLDMISRLMSSQLVTSVICVSHDENLASHFHTVWEVRDGRISKKR